MIRTNGFTQALSGTTRKDTKDASVRSISYGQIFEGVKTKLCLISSEELWLKVKISWLIWKSQQSSSVSSLSLFFKLALIQGFDDVNSNIAKDSSF